MYIPDDILILPFQVYDKDLVGSDDFMGQVEIDLQELNLKK